MTSIRDLGSRAVDQYYADKGQTRPTEKKDDAKKAGTTVKQTGTDLLQATGSKAVDQYYEQRGLTRPGTEKKAAETKAAPTEKDKLQGAVARAGDKTQDILSKADANLTKQIESATKSGDFRQVKDLTEKQAQLRSAIETNKKSNAAQGADLKAQLNPTDTSSASNLKAAATSSTVAAGAEATEKSKTDSLAQSLAGASDADKVMKALAARTSELRNTNRSPRGSLFNLSA